MKQRFLFLLLIVFCFCGCKKDEPSDPEQEKLALLTSKTWKLSLVDDHPESNPSGTLLYYAPQQCEQDDSYNFVTNNQLTIKSGELKCNTDEASTSTSDYGIDLASEKISIGGTTFTLDELSETQLKYSTPIPASANSAATLVFIFKH